MASLKIRNSRSDSRLKFVNNTRILGRKRVVPTNGVETSNISSSFHTPRRSKQGRSVHMERSNHLELLPQDVLVRVLCKVDHSDLKHLLLVSKYVKDTALLAKELHFNYNTPLPKRTSKQFGSGRVDSEEPPNTPMQCRVARSRIDGGKLASLVVILFASP